MKMSKYMKTIVIGKHTYREISQEEWSEHLRSKHDLSAKSLPTGRYYYDHNGGLPARDIIHVNIDELEEYIREKVDGKL